MQKVSMSWHHHGINVFHIITIKGYYLWMELNQPFQSLWVTVVWHNYESIYYTMQWLTTQGYENCHAILVGLAINYNSDDCDVTCASWCSWSRLTEKRTYMSRVSCQKGPICHAQAWQVGPFWLDTLDVSPALLTLCKGFTIYFVVSLTDG